MGQADIQGTLQSDVFTGKATTRIKFEDFGMSPPRVAIVLSVQDAIGLEMDIVALKTGQ